MCVITYAELEIAVGNWPFSDQFLPFGRTNSIFLAKLYIPMGKPLLVYNCFQGMADQFQIYILSSTYAVCGKILVESFAAVTGQKDPVLAHALTKQPSAITLFKTRPNLV